MESNVWNRSPVRADGDGVPRAGGLAVMVLDVEGPGRYHEAYDCAE
jgi:hypothetical protein